MERYYTVAEVAGATGLPKRTIYAAMSAGLLAYVTPNGGTRGRRVRERDVAAWLEGKKGAAGQERPPERGPMWG